MSKIEDKAKEFLKKLASHTLYEGTIDELEVYEPDDVIWAYKEGYHQAEKDLKLTWKDIADILDVTDVIANDDSMEERLKTMSEEEYYQEILKRFKERKDGSKR